MIDLDPRLRTGAYITDGMELYEVMRRRNGLRGGGSAAACVLVENCRSLCCAEFLARRILSAFRLVRAAPAPQCPDLVDEIDWEPTPVTR